MEVYFDFNIINILIVMTIFVNAILGILIFLKGEGNKNSRGYLFVVLAILLWAFSMISYRSADNVNDSILWAKLLYAAATFTASGFLYFSFVFPSEKLNFSLSKKIIVVVANAFMVFLSLWNEAIIKNVTIPEIGEKIINWGEWYFLYNIYIPGLFIWGFINLYRNYRKSQGIERTQISYVFWGYFIAANLAMTSNLLLPTLNYFRFNWIGQIFTIIMVGFTTYAILKHHLLNIRVIATEIFVILTSITLLIKIFISATPNEIILNITIFLAVVIFGILLIRSVLHEVRTREQMEKLAGDLEIANEKLKELDKMKSEFVSIASHQLRTPITAVKGYSSMLLEGSYGQIPEKAKGALEKIFESSNRLVHMITDFLTLSRIERGKIEYNFQKNDLKEIVISVMDEFKAANTKDKKGLNLSLDIDEKEDYVLNIDQEKIRQVIYNIIENAMKYTHQGFVKVSLAQTKDKSKVVVKIQDSGIGLSKESLGKIFQKFGQAGKNGKIETTTGVGLGLYVAQEIMKAHHGDIRAESEGEGKGSTFYLELPVNFEVSTKNQITSNNKKE